MKHRHHTPPRSLAALAGLDLLRDWAPDDLVRLTSSTDLVEVPAGQVIDRAGTRALQLVGVVDGAIRGVGPDGEAVVLGPGEQLGAAELLDDVAHAMTYTAITPAVLVVVFGPDFRAVAGSRTPAPQGHRPSVTPRPQERELVSVSAGAWH